MCCRCWDVLATDCRRRSASTSTLRSPWASCSRSSRRCGCAAALATAANWPKRTCLGLSLDIGRVSLHHSIYQLIDGLASPCRQGHPFSELILSDILFSHEPLIRMAAFSGLFALIAMWELLAP